MANLYFGAPWAPICDTGTQCPTPIGTPCLYCGIPIAEGDRGLLMPLMYEPQLAPWHCECSLRNIVGCIDAVQGRICDCSSRTDPSTPEEIYTEAVAVYRYITTRSLG